MRTPVFRTRPKAPRLIEVTKDKMVNLAKWSGFCGTITFLLLMAQPLAAMEDPLVRTDFDDNIERVYADDQQADVRVVFGYDGWEVFKDPCDPGRARRFIKYLIGRSFVEQPRDTHLDNLLGVGPQANNLHVFVGPGRAGQTLRVSLIWSALTSSMARNIGVLYPEQLRCSNQALKFLQKAASEAGVLVYLGHSRGGGGPDTYPPVTLPARNGETPKVDYSYYRQSCPGIVALDPHFAKAREKPHIIALTSCLTNNFHGWLSSALSGKITPTSLLLSTRLTHQLPLEEEIENCDEGLMVLVTLIEALQQRPSQAALKKRLLACEIDEYRNSNKPAWKLTTLPESTRRVVSTPETIRKTLAAP